MAFHAAWSRRSGLSSVERFRRRGTVVCNQEHVKCLALLVVPRFRQSAAHPRGSLTVARRGSPRDIREAPGWFGGGVATQRAWNWRGLVGLVPGVARTTVHGLGPLLYIYIHLCGVLVFLLGGVEGLGLRWAWWCCSLRSRIPYHWAIVHSPDRHQSSGIPGGISMESHGHEHAHAHAHGCQ